MGNILEILAKDERCPVKYVIEKMEEYHKDLWINLLSRKGLTLRDLGEIKEAFGQNSIGREGLSKIKPYLSSIPREPYKEEGVWEEVLVNFGSIGEFLAIHRVDWNNLGHRRMLIERITGAGIRFLIEEGPIPKEVAFQLTEREPVEKVYSGIKVIEEDISWREQDYLNYRMHFGYRYLYRPHDTNKVDGVTRTINELEESALFRVLQEDVEFLEGYLKNLLKKEEREEWNKFQKMQLEVPVELQRFILNSQNDQGLEYLAKIPNLDRDIREKLESNWNVKILLNLANRSDATEEYQKYIESILLTRKTDWSYWWKHLEEFTPLAQKLLIKAIGSLESLDSGPLLEKMASDKSITLETEESVLAFIRQAESTRSITQKMVQGIMKQLIKNPSLSFDTLLKIVKDEPTLEACRAFVGRNPSLESLLLIASGEKSYANLLRELESLPLKLQLAVCAKGDEEELVALAGNPGLDASLQTYLANGTFGVCSVLSTRSDLAPDVVEILWNRASAPGVQFAEREQLKVLLISQAHQFNYDLIEDVSSVTKKMAVGLAQRQDLPLNWAMKLARWKHVAPRSALSQSAWIAHNEVGARLAKDSSVEVRSRLLQQGAVLSTENFEILLRRSGLGSKEMLYLSVDSLPTSHLEVLVRVGEEKNSLKNQIVNSAIDILKQRYIESGELYENHKEAGQLYTAISFLLLPEVPLEVVKILGGASSQTISGLSRDTALVETQVSKAL